MSFPIIGSFTVWSEWGNAGTGAWNMWFMAPYGSWIYAAFVKNNTTSFKKIDIGGSDGDYPVSGWSLDATLDTPLTVFPYEQHDGFPDGSTNLGCIRYTSGVEDPYLFLVGRSNSSPSVDDAIIHRFDVANDFEQVDANYLIPQLSGTTFSVDQICGIEVTPTATVPEGGPALFLLTNNRNSEEFSLHRYDYAGFDGGAHNPTDTVLLSDATPGATVYMENNTSARLRGIGRASDGNILVFINTGLSAIQTKVLKFSQIDLTYMGVTDWTPNISASTWAYLVQNGEVFMHFQAIDSSSTLDPKTAIYYDRATGIPDESRSNLIIDDNLTTFGHDDPITLKYHARDAWNIDVENVYCRFEIDGEDRTDSSTWNDRIGSIQEESTEIANPFFDSDGVPTAISARTQTASNGIALAYYKPMRTGTGTERENIKITCPAGSD